MNYNHIPPDVMTKYLTDDLSAEEKQTAELHIAVCPECAAKLDEQRRFEDAAARSYPRTFSGKLDADCTKAIDEAIRDRLNTPGDSPLWTKRIRGAVVIQFFTVAAVALLLFLMITAPTGTAGGKKEKGPASNEAETVLAPDKIPAAEASAEVKEAETKPQSAAVAEQKAAVPEEKKAEEAKPAVQAEVLNPGLIRVFALNEISLRPLEKEPFQKGVVCMNSPFEPGALILLAVTDPKADPAGAGIRIQPAGQTTLLTVFAKEGENNAVAAALACAKTEDPAFVFAKVVSGNESFDVSAKDVWNKEDAPAPLRLAAVMLAAGKPRLLLKRDIREKMIEELKSLAENEYAGSPQVARFLEKLQKVK